MSNRRLGGQPVAQDPFSKYFQQQQNVSDQDSSGMRELGGKTDKELTITKRVKLKRKVPEQPPPKSPNAMKRETEERFNKLAERAMKQREDRNQRMLHAAQRLIDMVKDKTLKRNRLQVQEVVENDARKDLIDLMFEVNNDELETYDGMGSTALVNLLMKVVLIQRDRINDLEFILSEVAKDINGIHNSIGEIRSRQTVSGSVEGES